MNNCSQPPGNRRAQKPSGMFGRSLPITITLAITAINGPANYYSRRVNILRWGDAEAGRGDSGDCPETGSAQCAIICTPMENLPFGLYTVQCVLFCSAIKKNSIVLENFPFTYLCIIHKSTALQLRVAKVNFPTSPSLMPLPLCPVEYFIGDRPPPCLVNLYDGNGGRLQYVRN